LLATVARSLFPLFYLVEIRHRPTPSIAISHPLTGAVAQENKMPIWQLRDCLLWKPHRERWAASGPRESFMFSVTIRVHRDAPFYPLGSKTRRTSNAANGEIL